MYFEKQMAKLVLDDYFSSNEFLQTAEASAAYDGMINSTSSTSSTPTMTAPAIIPISHQLNSSSPFADSGIGLNMMSATQRLLNNNSVDIDDDVFIVENGKILDFVPLLLLNLKSSSLHCSKKTLFDTRLSSVPHKATL